MSISKKDHAAAAEYLRKHARTLEAALYAYLFEGASPDPAILALAAFQNPDGGFGNALEPDMRLADSSVIATTVAFSHFRTLRLKSDHPMVKAACQYLNAQYLPDEKRWRIMPANVDDAPHAPWWTPGGSLWNSRLNPTAEIVGYLYEYPEHFAAALRDELTATLVQYADAHADQAMEMHDLLCYVALIDNPAVPETVKLKLLPALTKIADKTVERSPEKWPEYTIPPLAIIAAPESPFARQFSDILPQNLEFAASWRSADGAWHPNWQWGDAALWAQVEREWTGVQTLSMLRKMRAFGQLTDRND